MQNECVFRFPFDEYRLLERKWITKIDQKKLIFFLVCFVIWFVKNATLFLIVDFANKSHLLSTRKPRQYPFLHPLLIYYQIGFGGCEFHFHFKNVYLFLFDFFFCCSVRSCSHVHIYPMYTYIWWWWVVNTNNF